MSNLCDPMDCSPPGSFPQDSPGKNTGVGCHALLQGIFPTQGSKTHVSYVSYRGIQICKLCVGPETFLPKHTPPTHSLLFIPAATTIMQDTTILLLKCCRCNLTGLPTISFHMSLRVMPFSCLDILVDYGLNCLRQTERLALTLNVTALEDRAFRGAAA